MNQDLYDRAETAYEKNRGGTVIVLEDLCAWLLAEVAFASVVTNSQATLLGGLPENDLEILLMFETASVYRNFRQSTRKATLPKHPNGMIAIRPEKK